jgi:beta-lactamase class D
MKIRLMILSVIIICGSNILFAQSKDTIDLKTFFHGHPGAFVLFDMNKNKYFRYNDSRCAERFLPASTFKIPNSLIGLETLVIKDENFVIKWDGTTRPIKEWNRDHTLASAIKYSVVPYYQELARRVGKNTMETYLNKLDYGNKIIGKEVDRFWLDNSLKISADEQIEFLKRFYNYKLPISRRSIDIVKKILSEEKYNKSILKSKTGTGTKEDKKYIGWLVGYVEKAKNVYFFAFNVDAGTFDEVSQLRNKASREILKYMKVIE